jgi:hypothetical protein
LTESKSVHELVSSAGQILLAGGRLTARKCVLLWCSRMVGDFNAATLLHRVVVEVDIGAFVEAVVRGFDGGWGEVVVDVCEAADGLDDMLSDLI